MAFILNEFDAVEAVHLTSDDYRERPNLAAATAALYALVEWTNNNSDGWPYWNKPSTAATKLQQAIHDRLFSAYDKRVNEDLTAAELKAALTPVKSFLTRQGADPTEVLYLNAA